MFANPVFITLGRSTVIIMIMMIIGLNITDEYMNFVYFELRDKEINTGKIITRDLTMQLMQFRKESLKIFRLAGIRTLTSAIPVQRCTEKNARTEIFRASCWEDSFETKHKCSARQIPLSLKPTESLLCHRLLSIKLKLKAKISLDPKHQLMVPSTLLAPATHICIDKATKPRRYIRSHH